jgi:5-methylcytosine-specific restriction endonuclease McrA
MPGKRWTGLTGKASKKAIWYKWFEAHKEELYARNKKYRDTHKRKRNQSREYRALAISLLRQRDGNNCWLCGKDVAVEQESLDHVVMVSKGGEHIADNVKLAHLGCNMKRSRS